MVFQLWDIYLLEDNPFLHHFIAYSLLHKHQRDIMNTEMADLPGVLARLSINSVGEVINLMREATTIFNATPKSFCQYLYSTCYCPVNDSTVPLLRSLESDICLSISASELVSYLVLKMSLKEEEKVKLN